MKYLLTLALLMLAGCAEARPEHSAPYAVRLEFAGGGVCSGTAVGRDVILSATHCWEGGKLIRVNGEEAYALRILHDGADHALVRVNLAFARWAVAGGAPKQGERVSMIGNPSGEPDMYREGYVVRATADKVFIDMQGFGGDSGAGVFDSRGTLVAVVSAGALWIRPGTPFHMALTLAYPLAFTDEQWREIRA